MSCTCPASPALVLSGSRSRTTSTPSPPHSACWCPWMGTQCPPPGGTALSGIPGFRQVSVKQRTLQFLISRWKLMWARRPSSLLSNACTWASRMLGREDPCGLNCINLAELTERWLERSVPSRKMHVVNRNTIQLFTGDWQTWKLTK